jgi:hypothetical protein
MFNEKRRPGQSGGSIDHFSVIGHDDAGGIGGSRAPVRGIGCATILMPW